MTHLTRDVLIKKIVADEMVGCGGTDYIQISQKCISQMGT